MILVLSIQFHRFVVAVAQSYAMSSALKCCILFLVHTSTPEIQISLADPAFLNKASVTLRNDSRPNHIVPGVVLGNIAPVKLDGSA